MWEPRILDYLIWFFLFLIFLGVIFIYSKFKKTEEYKWLTIGFIVKAIGGLSFALIYIYYYGFGDTFRYFHDSQKFVDVLIKSPIDGLKLYFLNNSELESVSSYVDFQMKVDSEGWFMVKLTSIFSLISAKSYLGTTLLLSFVSFLGSYKFYLLCNKINSNFKINFILSFLVPSVLVWGTGILKDTFTLCSINYIIYYTYVIVIERKFKLLDFSLLLCNVYVLIALKSYILISFLPTILILLYLNYLRNLKSSMVKIVLIPMMFAIFFVIGLFLFNSITENTVKYSLENVENTNAGFSSWHKSLGGSYYDIGEFDFTILGVLNVTPAALNVTFFRPYFWETNSVFMLINSFESFIFFIIFIYYLIYFRLKIFLLIYRNSFLFALLFFCVIFAIAVGINSYNFGALARYKMPILSPFLLIFLYLNNYKVKK